MSSDPTRNTVRAAAGAGAVFFGLVVVNSNLQSGAPAISDSRRETFAFLAAHQDRVQISAVLWGFAMCAALVSLSGLLPALRGAAFAPTALAGGVLAAASMLTAALLEGTIAARLEDLGAAGARVVWTAYLLSLGATLFGLLLLIGAATAACLRTHLFARWFCVASVVLVLVSIAGACTIGFASAGLQVIAGVALLLDSAWILAVNVFLFRRPALALREPA
jgi:hypothetical protein